MLSIKNLHKKFGKLKVLDGVSFDIPTSGTIAVLGPNGSGKTTIMKCILGMVIPNSGDITLNDMPVLKQWDYRREIGYLPQIAQFPDNLTVQELINMIKDLRSAPANESELIDRFELHPFLSQKLSNLSGGTKQKVNIVLTFMFDCPLYILDEPTAGLDPISMIRLKELIDRKKNEEKTIIVTTHIMSLVEELADEIFFLLDGKIYFRGTVDQLKKETIQEDLEHAIANILTND
ncbi:MAG: ABC transporter ATP-binding protein [Cytophagales bacterium]|nr:ABC transporter ATP-binding protein [Cytophagales bacterium]